MDDNKFAVQICKGDLFTLQGFQVECRGRFAYFRLWELFCKTVQRNYHQEQKKQKNSMFKGVKSIHIVFPHWKLIEGNEDRIKDKG